MALTAQAWTLSVTIVDYLNKRSTLNYTLQPQADLAGYEAAASAIVGALNNVTDSAIVGYEINRVYKEDALTLPVTQQPNAVYAIISNRIDTTTEKWGQVRIPNPASTIFVAATGSQAGTVDPADISVGQYIGLFENPGEAYVSDGEHFLPASTANTNGRRVSRGAKLSS